MLSAVPERTSTLVSCRLEDWANPNARIKFRKKYLQVFFRVFFFGYPLFNMISFRPEIHETLFYVRDCGCDHVMPEKTFFFPYLSHAIFGPGRDTQDKLGRGFAPFFLQHKDMHLWTADLRWGESAPHLQNLAPLGCWEGRGRKKSSSLTPQVLLGVRGLYIFFSFILSFVYFCACAEGWVLFKKYKPLSPESTQPVAQCSTGLAAEPFLYSLCTGQGFFHFMHHP